MSANVKLATPQGYYALDVDTVCNYLSGIKEVAQRLGGAPHEWNAEEVGDGNLNLVFIVRGVKGAVCAKQALPYVRLVGESWPLPLSRAHFEHLALVEETKAAPQYLPELYHYDALMALTVMEFLSPHIILRKGLVRGIQYPKMAEDLGKFLAHTLFKTSDLYLDAKTKKAKIADYLTNTAMCQISEDLIFDEPYFDAELNRHTSPQLDDIAAAFKQDTALKLAVQEMKWKFQNNAEALLHGDLHTGSVMVTESDTRVIDPEFAFFGPIGFDVGAVLANMFMAYFSQEGHGQRSEYAEWILEQIDALYKTFEAEFRALCQARNEDQKGGDIYQPRLYIDAPVLKDEAVKARLAAIWSDTLGFTGCKMIRRILGLAHVEDFESIEDADVRGSCERKALKFGRSLLIQRSDFKSLSDLLKTARAS